jgi:hypothetical protein
VNVHAHHAILALSPEHRKLPGRGKVVKKMSIKNPKPDTEVIVLFYGKHIM